jgi:hypothetical protein
MSKTVAHSTAIQVVKSAEKRPAQPEKREYGEFDKFVENVDTLSDVSDRISHYEDRVCGVKFEWVNKAEHVYLDLDEAKKQILAAKSSVQLARRALTSEFAWAQKLMKRCKRDEKWYDRMELYDKKGKGKRTKEILSRRVVSEQMALLVSCIPNTKPGSPEVFGRMLTEEIYARSPNACVLESACRDMRRTKKFLTIAEMYEALDKAQEQWSSRWDVLTWDIDETREQLEKFVAMTEAEIVEAEAKLAEREAKKKAEEWKRRLRREAYHRLPASQREAFELGQRHRGFDQRYRPEIPEEYGDEDHIPEFHAYHAGLHGDEIPGLELSTESTLPSDLTDDEHITAVRHGLEMVERARSEGRAR